MTGVQMVASERYEFMERLLVPEAADATARFRYVPDAYLAACQSACDGGIEYLLYYQSLINEED